MKTITINNKSIRFNSLADRFRMKLDYTTSKGVHRIVSNLHVTKEEAVRDLNFRINGLKNSGCEIAFKKH